MTLRKEPNGTYAGDFRRKGLARLHLSMRTTKKSEAEPRYQAVLRLFREAIGPAAEGPRALIDDLRTGKLAVERLETMVRTGVPLAPDAPLSVAGWLTFDEGIADYLRWVEGNENKRASTHRTAAAQLKRAAAFTLNGVRLGSLPMDRVPSAMIDAYQRSLLDGGSPPNTVTAYMTRVGAVWSWCQRRENRLATEGRRVPHVLPVPIDPETASRDSSSRDRWLTVAEAERLLAATPDRLQLAVALGLFGGFRIGEVLHLRPTDIDLTVGTIAVQRQPEWQPKTKRAIRVVPIAAPLRPLIDAHLTRFASDAWMLPAIEDPSRPFEYSSFNLHFGRIVAAAELIVGRKDPRGVVFHTLRHTFASWLVMKGIDLYTVAQLLGDTLQTVEKVYAHLSPDVKRRAIAALADAMTMPTAGKRNDASSDTQTEVDR